MGSFNTSCMVSKQTIAPGDKCVIVGLHQSSTYERISFKYGETAYAEFGHCSSTCYPTRFWKPISAFFDCTYDDYGRFTLEDSKVNRGRLMMFLSSCLESLPVVEQGENKYHDVPCKLEEFMKMNTPKLYALLARSSEKPTEYSAASDECFKDMVTAWDYVYEVAQESRMFWRNYRGEFRPAGFGVFHKAAWDRLVSDMNANKGWDGESFDMREVVKRAYEKAVSRSDLAKDAGMRYFASMHLRETLCRIGEFEGGSYPGERHIMDLMAEKFIEGALTEEQMFAICKPWLEARYAVGSMLTYNLHLEPLVYSSQDYSNEIGAAYAKFVSKVSAAVTRERQVGSYGEFQPYVLTASASLTNEELVEYFEENDCPLEVLERTALENGTVKLRCEATAEAETMRELLESFGKDKPGFDLAFADA